MSKVTTNVTRLADISDVERNVNYIKFQLSQAEAMLDKHSGDDRKIVFVHLLEWKNSLKSELHELTRKNKRK